MKNDDLIAVINEDFNHLAHHGVPGQKWGVYGGHGRKYQNHAVYARGNPRYKNSKYMRAAKDRMNQKHYFTDHVSAEMDSADKLKNIPIENLSDVKRLSNKWPMRKSIESVRNNINHPNDRTDRGREYNCPNCALAFEMTERGYDVIARPKPYRSNVENIEDFFVNGKLTPIMPDDNPFNINERYDKWEECKKVNSKSQETEQAKSDYWDYVNKAAKQSCDKAISSILKQGDGARGIIVEGYMATNDPRQRTTAYHAYNYKVENGKVKCYDVQSRNTKLQNGDSYIEVDSIDPRELYIMRTDNLELSPNCTKGVYSNRGIKY